MYKIFICITFLALLLVFPANTSAADQTITCSADGPCFVTPGGTLFNETDWTPGDFVVRNLSVINQDGDESCNLTLLVSNPEQSPQDFATKLNARIEQGSTNYFNQPFQNLFNQGTVSLGTIGPSTSNLYTWEAKLDSNAGNSYQGASISFDFDMNFSCGVSPTSTPSATSTPTSSVEGAGQTTSVSTGGAAAPILGVTTGEVSAAETSGPTPSPSPSGEVLGETTCTARDYPWWIPLIVQALVAFVYLRKRYKDKAWQAVLAIGGIGVVSQIVHEILGCNCATSSLCPWYWAFNLGIVALSFVYYLYKYRNNKK